MDRKYERAIRLRLHGNLPGTGPRGCNAGDVPVGAIVVHNGEIIGRGQNIREQHADPTGHAEVVALREAAQHLGHWRCRCHPVRHLEPCIMCAGALVNARVVVWSTGVQTPRPEPLTHLRNPDRY